MFIEQIPAIFRNQRGLKWRKSHWEKKIYLTFDDGPIPEVTPWVLDLLDSYGIKATFFCVGENVVRNREVYEQILQGGHRIGNHSYNHLNGWHTEKQAYLDNIEKANEILHTDLFRPPHGWMKLCQKRAIRKKYKIILWDVITRDYNPKLPPERVLYNACHYVRNGSIVVFHDSLKTFHNLKLVLPSWIEFCLSKGYEFCLL